VLGNKYLFSKNFVSNNKAMKFLPFCLLLFVVVCCKNDDGSQIACTEEFVFGLNVQVRDAVTGGIILNEITVTAIDGAYTEELSFNFDTFIGAGERPGDYTLEVIATGYVDFTSNVIRVEANDCHVIPESVEIELQPI